MNTNEFKEALNELAGTRFIETLEAVEYLRTANGLTKEEAVTMTLEWMNENA